MMSHPFFAGIDVDALLARKIEPEFKPELDQTGLNNFDSDIVDGNPLESHVPEDVKDKIKNFKELDDF